MSKSQVNKLEYFHRVVLCWRTCLLIKSRARKYFGEDVDFGSQQCQGLYSVAYGSFECDSRNQESLILFHYLGVGKFRKAGFPEIKHLKSAGTEGIQFYGHPDSKRDCPLRGICSVCRFRQMVGIGDINQWPGSGIFVDL